MKEDIQHILEKYSRNACSEEELRRLEAWFQAIGQENPGTMVDDTRLQRLLQQIQASPRYSSADISSTRSRVKRLLVNISVAALALVGIGLAVYWTQPPAPTEKFTVSDIAAGEDKAVLTLADGRKIILDGSSQGRLVQENGITIYKNIDNILTYTPQTDDDQVTGDLVYNTIETPRGGQYQVILSDGTTVWLNAESSLTFPTRFSTDSRQVQIRGEAYFSVVPQETETGRRTPFIVETDQQRIEVLGTEFNVNTYADRSRQQTTLVKGSVRVIHQMNGQQAVLAPGQQARIGNVIEIVQADLEKEIAWKQGDFIFKNDRLQDILQQVSRWYDITVSYPANRAGLRYSGMVSRKQPLSSIIAMLESTGTIQVRIKERRIIIE